MHRPWNSIVVAALLLMPGMLTAAGCNSSSTPTPPIKNSTPQVTPAPVAPSPVSGITKVPRDKLAIGDYMPPLDDDRVEIAKPQGWQALPRDSAYLTRFYETSRNGLPRIEISVEPRTYGELTTVTPENVEQFVKLVAAELGDLKLVESVIPLQIGERACARYVGLVDLKLSANKTISAERQRLLVLQDGRLYTIDLLVLPNTLLRSRDAAYAVCASLRFGGVEEPVADGALLPE